MGTQSLGTSRKRHVYRLGVDELPNPKQSRQILGGKAAALAEMMMLGLPVPPAFTVTTEICDLYHKNDGELPQTVWQQVKESMQSLEEKVGLKFAASERPLLVSVRSGAPVSMPGMMDTILNLGVCETTLPGLARLFRQERAVYDAYRRLIAMYGDVVLDISSAEFETVLTRARQQAKVKHDHELSADILQSVCQKFLEICVVHRHPFPQDPWVQLQGAIGAVFRSWFTSRAMAYRRIHRIPDTMGTAVTVQAMVFGNMGNRSATGVCFTRHPATGERKVFGEYMTNAQGEDVVAGIRTPNPLRTAEKGQISLETEMPQSYQQLLGSLETLERHYKDMQDVEFTVQEGTLYLLQTRTGKRTARAAVHIAVDLVGEGVITPQEAVLRVDPYSIDQLLHPQLDPNAEKTVIGKGLPASPGVATGRIVFDADSAMAWAGRGEKVMLLRHETSPEDIEGMHVAQGILTALGGMTSHAAVVARGMGKCCVSGCVGLMIDLQGKTCRIGERAFKEGDVISVDGSSGEVLAGEVKTIPPALDDHYEQLMAWADQFRTLKVRANADTPRDAKRARELGAEGIGLTRTEHMFFDAERISMVRQMILATDPQMRKSILQKLKKLQCDDFVGIFQEMDGYPVTVRLLDPPLHEFLPKEDREIQALAKALSQDEKWVRQRIESLSEVNPMLGHRGARVGVSSPDVYQMQVEAIAEAGVFLKKQKQQSPQIEIMVPLTFEARELKHLRRMIDVVIQSVQAQNQTKLNIKVGTMIEIPRAALVADQLAEVADFFSFGTNDLTQMTLGISRDDSAKFISTYIDQKVLLEDPFLSIDEEGVGQLMMMAVSKARMVGHRQLHYGICGEHGGDPRSIAFCQKLGLDYVSCSPLRVPIARLAAAQARLKQV